ncbi:MAG TPA: DUF72 domain-containing protein [Solirubrobacterales bacterium]|nr:DUF72 domain-containing protein [Solirubrobacterales bacterium]
MKEVRIGCSGWNYRSWREDFYPPRTPASRWLEHYASAFDTVEVNATFYRLPERSTTAKWAAQAPDDFRFAVKGSRYLTHIRRLRDLEAGLDRFWERLEPLREADKLGPVLWQLPPNFQRDDETLAAALATLPPADHCFEFRHPSWFVADVYGLLERHGASLALGHDARRPLPEAAPVGPIAYLRLHYGERGRRGNYSPAELGRWRRRIAAWRAQRPVFVYLNNDWEGFAPRNAKTLRAGLS